MNITPNSPYEYQVGGSLPTNASSYVNRQADRDLYDGLMAGEFCYVLNSRQMGKSSLRVQTMERLKAEGIACAEINLQKIGSQNLTAEQWYASVIKNLLTSFDLSNKINLRTWWRERESLSFLTRFSEFIEDILLVNITQNLVIFVDEIDSVLSLKFSIDDFFIFIRDCYNQRADKPEYKRLTFTLLGVAAPSNLIQDKNRTPFNIGRAIELNGFQLHEVEPLTQGLVGKVSNPQGVLEEILDWTGGQPFLTQKLCKLIPKGMEKSEVEKLVYSCIIENWEAHDEPEHLRTMQDRILRSEKSAGQLLGLYQTILQQGAVSSDNSPEQMELRLTGLVVKQSAKLKIYNNIYKTVFNHNWVDKALANLRPGFYHEAITAWLASGSKDESRLLRGQALQEAEKWGETQNLSTLDNKFLNKSRDLEQRERQQKQELEQREQRERQYKQELETGKKQKQILEKANQQAKQIIRYGVIGIAVSVCVAAIFSLLAMQQKKVAEQAKQGTKIELAGLYVLGQVRYDSLEALFSAMQAAQELKSVVQDSSVIKDYPATSPLLALQRILDSIHEQNYFEAGQGEVKGAVFLPGDKGLITAGEGKENKEDTLQMWNLAGKKEVSLKGHKGGLLSGVNAVSVGGNAQNPVIASAGEDGTVRLWDKSGKQIRQLLAEGKPNYDSFTAIAVSPDGQRIIAGKGNGTVYLWDNKSGRQLKTWVAHGNKVTAISFSKNGQILATAGEDGLARIWTVTGNKQGEIKHPQIKTMLGVSLSPDGQFVATASDDNRARIWTVNGQEVRRLEGHQGWVTVVNFSPNGQSIATGSNDGIVKLWNTKTGEQIQNFRGHQGMILSASFSIDGKRLVSTGRDGFVRLWNLADKPVQRLELTGFKDDVNAIAFSPDGKTIAGAGNEGVMRLWDAKSGKELKVWKEPIQRISDEKNVQDITFSPDGNFIVVGGLNVPIATVWNLKGSLTEAQANLNANKETQEIHQGGIMSVAVSPDSQLVATGGTDKMMQIWKPKSPNGELVKVTQKQESPIFSVVFTADKKQIVTADGDGNVAFWDLDGNQINKWQKVHQTQISGLVMTPDGNQIVTADKTGNVKISDRSRKQQKEFFSYQSGINELAISPDGKLIATGGMDGTVRLWDFQGRQVAEFRNPKGAIWSIAFSPKQNDRRIAMAGDNGFVSVQSIDNLTDLMKNGCTWLQDYLTLHPSEKNSLCP